MCQVSDVMHIDSYLHFLKVLPPQLVTMIVAMIPVGEYRVSIPLALGVYHLSLVSALVWSILGAMIPAIVIVFWIGPVIDLVSRKWPAAHRAYLWFEEHVRARFAHGHAKYGIAAALILFIAFPFGVSGSWSGALAAFLFGMPKRMALISLLIGVTVGAGIIALVSMGAVKLFF